MYTHAEKINKGQSRAVANTANKAKPTTVQLSFNGLSSKSGFLSPITGIGQLMGYIRTRPLGQKPGKTGKDWGIGFGNLKIRHSHLTFDNNHDLPTVGNSDNVGFHPGGLFSENWGAMGYTVRETFSDEDKLASAANANANPGGYNLITNNCQDWVSRVKNSYNAVQDIEMAERKKK
ncbi:MAG TPA: hypothetical protein PKH79_12795 [Prolixibacteraceae bacterium]|nr:hypothetical protein [Prolixibacteraceae bacterium]HPS13543.1 hypothetical protein [Prolixibacteraceae bacterium]